MIIYLVYFLFTKLMLFINQSFITRILAYFSILYFFGTLNHKPYFWHSVNLSRRLGWPSTEPFNQSIAWFAKPGMPDYCLHNQGCQITACKIRDAISFLAKPGILEYFQKQGYLINAFKTRGAQVLLLNQGCHDSSLIAKKRIPGYFLQKQGCQKTKSQNRGARILLAKPGLPEFQLQGMEDLFCPTSIKSNNINQGC